MGATIIYDLNSDFLQIKFAPNVGKASACLLFRPNENQKQTG
jgi:hypothetical protein